MWGIAYWIVTEGEARSAHGTFVTIYKTVRYQVSDKYNTKGKLLCVKHRVLIIEKLHIISSCETLKKYLFTYLLIYSYIYCLLKDAISRTEFIASNDRIITK
jgi:hypothetical protein